MAEQALTVAPASATEPTAPGASSSSPAAIDADSADFAQAIAALTGAAEAPKTAPAVETPAAPPPVVEAPKPTPEPDADTKAILARMARLEFEAEQAREEAAKLRGVSEPAAKFAKIQELKAAKNFQAVLQELGVTSDELQSMILEGNKPLAPEVVELKRQQEELSRFKQELEARESAAAQARAQAEFKAKELAPKLSPEAFPLGRAVYGEALVEEVFAVLQHMYRSGDKNPSVAAAGKVVEDYLGNIRAKLTPSQAAAVAQASSATAPTTTLTNAPTTAPRVAVDMDTDEGRMEAALKLLKGN
jgi:hypothetical protein